MQEEMQQNPGIINRDKFGSKNFEKYVYFVSKASNYTVIIKPQMEERMANGEIKISRDENGKEMIRMSVEFHNGMKRFEKTPENEVFIKYLREIIVKELDLSENKRSIKEITKPVKLYTEAEVKNIMKTQKEQFMEEQTKTKEGAKK